MTPGGGGAGFSALVEHPALMASAAISAAIRCHGSVLGSATAVVDCFFMVHAPGGARCWAQRVRWPELQNMTLGAACVVAPHPPSW